MSQYIRCKRKNQTVFLHVETFTTFQEIKKQLAENFSMEPEKIVLWANDKVCLLWREKVTSLAVFCSI